jgi:ankyrin repeat protein
MFNHTKIVECLLEAGANPQVKAVSGETAIEVAEDYLAAKMRALVASTK